MAAVGAAVRPLETPAWTKIKAAQPAFNFKSIEGALGQGLTVGLLGGFQAIVADFFWIRTNTVWETYDLPATQTYIKLVTAIDPRPIYFWQNGSRMIAYDMPNWRIDEEIKKNIDEALKKAGDEALKKAIEKFGGWAKVPDTDKRKFDKKIIEKAIDDAGVPDAVKRKFEEEQSSVGVDFLKTGLGFHPHEPLLYIEIANVFLNRLKDPATASEWYLKATEQPNCPAYAFRIYAELLRRIDRKPEALAWLKKLYPTLPKDGEAAMYAMPHVVLERIRELEDELKIPLPARFDPGPGVVEPPRPPATDGAYTPPGAAQPPPSADGWTPSIPK